MQYPSLWSGCVYRPCKERSPKAGRSARLRAAANRDSFLHYKPFPCHVCRATPLNKQSLSSDINHIQQIFGKTCQGDYLAEEPIISADFGELPQPVTIDTIFKNFIGKVIAKKKRQQKDLMSRLITRHLKHIRALHIQRS